MTLLANNEEKSCILCGLKIVLDAMFLKKQDLIFKKSSLSFFFKCWSCCVVQKKHSNAFCLFFIGNIHIKIRINTTKRKGIIIADEWMWGCRPSQNITTNRSNISSEAKRNQEINEQKNKKIWKKTKTKTIIRATISTTFERSSGEHKRLQRSPPPAICQMLRWSSFTLCSHHCKMKNVFFVKIFLKLLFLLEFFNPVFQDLPRCFFNLRSFHWKFCN